MVDVKNSVPGVAAPRAPAGSMDEQLSVAGMAPGLHANKAGCQYSSYIPRSSIFRPCPLTLPLNPKP